MIFLETYKFKKLKDEWIETIMNMKIHDIKKLIDAGVDVNMIIDNSKGVALHYAVRNLDILKMLLDAPNIQIDKLDEYNNSALMYASFSSYISSIKILLDADADYKITDIDGVYFYDMLSSINKEIIFKEYPEIEKFSKKVETVKKFKI